jgi:hypothetical protein
MDTDEEEEENHGKHGRKKKKKKEEFLNRDGSNGGYGCPEASNGRG